MYKYVLIKAKDIYLMVINSNQTPHKFQALYIYRSSFFTQIMLNIQYTTLFESRGLKGELSFILYV